MADDYLLQGKLTSQSLENLFELFQGKNLMGTLFVSDPMTEKIIYFSMGGVRLIVVGEGRTPKVEDILLQQGLASADTLKQTLELQKQTGETTGKKIRMGDLLVEKDLLSREQLQEVYKIRLRSELEDLFTWDGADYKFIEGNPSDQFYDPKHDSIGLSFDLETFLKDIKKKHQDFAQIAQILDSDKLILEPSEKRISSSSLELNLPEKSITAAEKEVYEQVDGERNLQQIAERIPHRSKKEVYEFLFSLLRKKYIKKASREKQKVQEQKGIQDEIMSLEEALNRAVDQLKIRAKLAGLYENAGNQEKAAENYAQAGDLAAKQDAEQALRHYEKAVALNPKNLPLHKKVYNFYLNNNRAADALKKGKEYTKLLLGFGMLNRAKEFFSDLVKMAPGDLEIRRAYAENLLALNKEEEAVQEFKEAANLAKNKGDKASLVQVLEKIHILKEDDRAVQKQLYSIQGKRLQALLSINPWSILKVAFLLALLFLGVGYFYENGARQLFLQEGNRVRKLIKKGEFAKAEEVLDKIRTAYPLSSVADRVFELEKERKKAQQIEEKNQELKALQKGVALEVDGDYREALELYGKLSLEARDEEVKKLAGEGKKRMEEWELKGRNLSMDLQRLLDSYKDASDEEITRAFQMGKEMIKLFPKSVYVEGLRVPLRLYTVPKGADILVGGKYQDNTPWTGLFSLSQKGQRIQLEKKGFQKISLKLEELEKGVLNLNFQPTHREISLGSSLFKGFISPDQRWFLAKGEYLTLVSLYNFRVIPRPFFSFEEIGEPLFIGSQLLIGTRDSLSEISLESSDPQMVKKEKFSDFPGLPQALLGQNRLLLEGKSTLVEWNLNEKKIISQTPLDSPLIGPGVFAEGWVYLAAGKKIYRLLREVSPMNVQVFYESFSDFTAVPVVVGRRIYAINRKGIEFLGISRDGEKIQSSRLHSMATQVTSLGHLKENRVVVTTQNRIYCLELSKTKSQELWSFDLGSPPSAPVLVDGEKVYLPCEKGETLAFWLREELSSTKLRGNLLWILKTKEPVQAAPVATRDKIYFLGLDGQVCEIRKEEK